MTEVTQKPALAPAPKRARAEGSAPPPPRGSRGGMLALVIKVVLLGLLDAAVVFALFVLAVKEQWLTAVVVAAVAILINVIYLKRGLLPAKYLTPGLIFLAVFQIFVVVYTGYIAFTNYGDQHNGSKEDAVAQIIRTSQERVPDSPQYTVSIVRQGDTFGMLVADPDGDVEFGTNDTPLKKVDSELNGLGAPKGIDGWDTLNLNQVVRYQDQVLALSVPISSDPNDGTIRSPDGSSAFVFTSSLAFDQKADTFTNEKTGTVYADDGRGTFRSDAGEALTPGWRVWIGFDNFAQAFTNEQIRDPLIRVVIWTFAFAILSVLSTFALGLFLALVFNHPNVRGKKFYRVLVILPYAFPAFLGGLVWAGLLNPEFGFINQVFFGGAQIPWLSDPWLARFSVLLVNLWLGYPYMFLVCTGALQSLPDDVVEAAKMDGASAWRTFRSVKLPLLFVSVAPLLIASFAFNFNNFNVIFMLTRGWPRFTDTTLDIGSTDLLITLVYKVAFGGGGGRDYGLASAFAILIFIIVAVVSAISFKRTRALEDLN
ncbi:ABC transporter permease subunit [Rathayibacter sp. YIM 133350]|uniref:ABC transporter permease subunit n=1 Tax=Rathayibacter sp. YIM 133350 TaxID=3131992 RepID=UPI00307D5400